MKKKKKRRHASCSVVYTFEEPGTSKSYKNKEFLFSHRKIAKLWRVDYEKSWIMKFFWPWKFAIFSAIFSKIKNNKKCFF